MYRYISVTKLIKKYGDFLLKELMTHLPPLPKAGVENVKIRENSEKIRGPPGFP